MRQPGAPRRPAVQAPVRAWTVLAVAVAVLVAGAVIGLAVVLGRGDGGGAPPLRTSPGTISSNFGAGAQCPAGALDGHCIVPTTAHHG